MDGRIEGVCEEQPRGEANGEALKRPKGKEGSREGTRAHSPAN